MALPERFVDETGEARVDGFLHAAHGSAESLVLTHGAGGNCNATLLVALSEVFAASEFRINVLRCNLPFRQKRPQGPPSPASAKDDQAGLRRAVTLMTQKFEGRVFLGGQSYGGRQASMLAAADPGLVDGLLLLSYPLHPPGRPQQLRTAHLPQIETPTLFVSGTKDPFGTIEELEAARKLIPAPSRLIAIESAGHSLLTKKNRAELVSAIVAAFRDMMTSGK